METAWTLPAGGDSEVEDEGNGEFFAGVRVEKKIQRRRQPCRRSTRSSRC